MSMQIAVFELSHRFYRGTVLLDENNAILVGFLSDDVGWIGAPRYKIFLEDPLVRDIGGNYSCFKKVGTDIYIGCVFDDNPYEDYIKIKQKNLILLLDQWDKLINQEPAEIFLFQEGDSYWLEGKGFPDQKL